jgi:hypothetical protein
MINSSHLEDLPLSAQEAIGAAEDRLQRAVDAADVEGTVGASKELIESVAKAVIDLIGGSYGSDVSVLRLANQTLEALKLHPAALQGRASLQRLGQSLISTVQAIAELRNTDGTGHGRSARSNLDMTHALLCRDVAVTWSRWTIASARRADRAPLDEIVGGISGPLSLSRGKLPALLKDIGLEELGDDDQRKVGLAVARRWSVNGTFLPLVDVIQPIARGDVEYPPAFCEGILEGLLLDHNGYLIGQLSDNINLAIDVGRRLPGNRRETAFKSLADRIEDASLSYKVDDEGLDQAAQLWRNLAVQQENATIGESLDRIASRIEGLRGAG